MSIGAIRRRTEALDLTRTSRTLEVRALERPLDRTSRSDESSSADLLGERAIDTRSHASSDLSSASRMFDAYRSKGAGSAKEGEDAGVDAAPLEPSVVPPPPPPDFASLHRLTQAADAFTPSEDTVPAARAAEIRAHLHAAETAIESGDYRTAAAEYAALGFPLPAGDEHPSAIAFDTAEMIGGADVTDDGVELHRGPHGNQRLNDLDGFAANARMMAALEDAGIHPSGNPPTREEALAYMQHVAHESGGDPHAATEASRMLIEGMVVHYSAAGEDNPVYPSDGVRYVLLTDPVVGERQSFASRSEALAAAHELGLEPSDVHAIRTHVPSDWDEAMSIGTHAGRHVGDCENKLYLQNQLLTAAGFTSIGSVSVDHGEHDHALGVLRAPNGQVYVTSNADSLEVHGTGRDGAVTEGDITRAVEDATRATYGLGPNGGLGEFAFSYGAEPESSSSEPGVEAARRASENELLETDELLLTR